MKQKPYSPPIVSLFLLERTSLHKTMRHHINAGDHLAFCAPGGYGKTVVVSQYLSKRRVTSWLTFSGADNEPEAFYEHLGEALNALATDDTLTVARDPEALVQAARAIPTKGGRRILVFDDLHLLVRHDLLHTLARVIDALPATTTTILLGRSVLPLEIEAVKRSFTVFDSNKLAFSLDEATFFFEEEGKTVSEEDIKALWERTQGWAMGLYALSFESGAGSKELESDNRDLSSFLEEGVWHRWSENTQTFLLQCSAAPYLTADIAAQLSERSDAEAELVHLYQTGAFLSKTNDDIYRFHDLFRDWLQEKAQEVLGEATVKNLNTKVAEWLFDREEYYRAAQLYIKNVDHDGIGRCMAATNRFGGRAENLSVESKVDFVNTYVSGLTPEFIEENPYLLSKCANVAFLSGNAKDFCRYADALTAQLPELVKNHPDLVPTAGFIGSLDFRVPLSAYAKKLMAQMAHMAQMPPVSSDKREASSSTMTQNLPLLHRSMRDFSEYTSFDESEIVLLRNTFGVMIGSDYPVMESCYLAGLHYERSNLREANFHALEAVRGLSDASRAETAFCAQMILAVVYDALGAAGEAANIYSEMKDFTEKPDVGFLQANYQAMCVSRALEQGNAEVADTWLLSQSLTAEPLALYRVPRYFATLRAFIAKEEYDKAIELGERIMQLAQEYVRPLDAIEAGVLTTKAYVLKGETAPAKQQLQKTLSEALPYEYTQQFVNQGKSLAPLFGMLPKKGKSEEEIAFTKLVVKKIGEALGQGTQQQETAHLSPQQHAVLKRLAANMSYAEIAQELGIGRGTVKTHVLQAYKALGAHTAEEAIAKAHALNILT